MNFKLHNQYCPISRNLNDDFVGITFIRSRINSILVGKSEEKKGLKSIGLDGRKDFTLFEKNQVKSEEHITYTGTATNYYRISSNKTRGYYFFRRPSAAGIIRMWVLIKGWYYYQNFINPDMKSIKTRKP